MQSSAKSVSRTPEHWYSSGFFGSSSPTGGRAVTGFSLAARSPFLVTAPEDFWVPGRGVLGEVPVVLWSLDMLVVQDPSERQVEMRQDSAGLALHISTHQVQSPSHCAAALSRATKPGWVGLWPEQRQSKERTRKAADSSASGRGFARLGSVWTGSGSVESVWGHDR